MNRVDLTVTKMDTHRPTVSSEVKAWETRPLDPIYPILYVDALVVKVRDGAHLVNKAAHIVVGIDTDGIEYVLGI